jgi:hypothetical protein
VKFRGCPRNRESILEFRLPILDCKKSKIQNLKSKIESRGLGFLVYNLSRFAMGKIEEEI